MRKPTLLLVEDSAIDVTVALGAIDHAFSDSLIVCHAESLKAAKEHLLTQPTDVIVLDLNLPDSHGVNTLDQIKDMAPAIPVIILSADSDERSKLQAIQGGALQFLTKGKDYRMIAPAIIAAMTENKSRTLSGMDFGRRVDAIYSLIQSEIQKLAQLADDLKMIRVTLFGNGNKRVALVNQVAENRRVVVVVWWAFWLVLGAICFAAGLNVFWHFTS